MLFIFVLYAFAVCFSFVCWLVSPVVVLMYVLRCSLLFMSIVLLGLVKTCLVLCILCLSLFLLCSWIVFVDLWIFFVRVLEFYFVSHAMPAITFVLVFHVFVKICFCLSRINLVLEWSICLSLLLSVMMFWIPLIVLLASFDGFNISNDWAVFSVEADSLSFELSPTALYNWTITLF